MTPLSPELGDLLVDRGFSIVRKASGEELVRKAGKLSLELEQFDALEVRRPGFNRQRSTAVQLLNTREVIQQEHLSRVTKTEAKKAIYEAVPSLLEPIEAVFSFANPADYARLGHEHYLEVVPDTDTSSTLNAERTKILDAIDSCSDMPLSEAEDLSCWFEHDPKMTLIYCSRRTTREQFNFAKSELGKILPISCTLEPMKNT